MFWGRVEVYISLTTRRVIGRKEKYIEVANEGFVTGQNEAGEGPILYMSQMIHYRESVGL